VPFAAEAERLEVTVHSAAGTGTPIVLYGRRSRDGETGQLLLHWELRERDTGEHSPRVAVAPQPHRPTLTRPDTVRVLAEAAADLARQEDPAQTLDHVVAQARAAVPSCDEAGVTLIRTRGRIETPAATGGLAAACDRLQHELGEGPSLDAVADFVPVRLPDTAHDGRWPAFAPRAAGLGAGSMLALPLVTPRGAAGSLNLYARRSAAFDEDDELVGAAFATHAGIALAHAELEANLRVGLRTREEIGRAVGILMERHRVTATVAFDLLVVASQHSHRKLRDVAAWVNETGEDPVTLLRERARRG
jgi:signal transduction protein with GAF and PtsI domain